MSKLPIVAIVGRANVGKSSLFNRFLAKRQAIVADMPGTTRDSTFGKALHNGVSFWLADTAGMKSAEDDFELSIQEQITQAADAADVILVVIDSNAAITDEDRRVAKLALKSKKTVILAANKADNKKKGDPQDYVRLGIKDIFLTSAEHNRGIDEVLDHLTSILPKRKDTSDDDPLRISFIGRPNVGKSSLFNNLLSKQLAVVSDVAGTTRDVNRQVIRYHERDVELLDTAGIRRSGKIGRGVEFFSVIRSMAAIEESDVCCLLLDAGEIGTKLDQKIAGMIKESGKGMIMVVSKWDLVDKDAYTSDQIARHIARDFPFVPWAPLIFTSAETGHNVTKLLDLATDIKKARGQTIETKVLNQWLKKMLRTHPASGLKNKHPNLTYMTQVDSNPPTFRVFGRDLKYLHWSYKRRLDNEIRRIADFNGTPVMFEFEPILGESEKGSSMGIRELVRMPGISASQDGPFLIVGLGNVGPKYVATRHNVGFMAVEAFSETLEGKFANKMDLKAQVLETHVDGQKVVLARPTTQMNRSGMAVSRLQNYFNVIEPRILVIYDDVDIAFGTIRTRIGGGNAGHNGIKSIEGAIGDSFARIRIGVKNNQLERTDTKDFVLKDFTRTEAKRLEDMFAETNGMIESFLREQLEPTSVTV